MTLTAKLKLVVNTTNGTDQSPPTNTSDEADGDNSTKPAPLAAGKYFFAIFKSFEVSTLKIYKGDEEQALEQMLA